MVVKMLSGVYRYKPTNDGGFFSNNGNDPLVFCYHIVTFKSSQHIIRHISHQSESNYAKKKSSTVTILQQVFTLPSLFDKLTRFSLFR